MGWKLLEAAHDAGIAGLISERSRLGLFHMCRMARDTPTETTPAGEYHGGHIEIGQFILGIATEDALKKAGNRCIQELKKHGLIEEVSGVGARKKKRYLILIGRFVQPPLVDPPVENSTS